jgi:hypothetical protein
MFPTHPRAGSNSERQSVGDPGHCERCAEIGHVRAHPQLGCGDVGCTATHGPDDPRDDPGPRTPTNYWLPGHDSDPTRPRADHIWQPQCCELAYVAHPGSLDPTTGHVITVAGPQPRILSSVPLTAKPSGERRCVCVTQHRPVPVILHGRYVWPLDKGGPDTAENLLWLCPTSAENCDELWQLTVRAIQSGQVIPWHEMRLFSAYVRGVVSRGWIQAWEAGQVP